ncbi:HlyC/CorC family transporter [Candidatus Marithrix sp. Canyon 246]|uniref:HlyC/CorC family transporter n=1 Tax=Candidatus Marithrix sp. Canyon 246 TaxID=1827136 RepID=UPI00084A130C|nr:transporter associated domain-containing protein [Candidatus Marithrix sp. Canyon 246]
MSSISWFEGLKQSFFPAYKLRDKKQLIHLLRDAEQANLLNVDALGMIEGVLKVTETHVRDVMIPRKQVTVLNSNDPPEKLVETIVDSGYSRFPVIGENLDDIQGIFLAKDLLDFYAKSGKSQFNMRDVMRAAVFIPESKRLNVLLREFRTSRNHIAIVVNEYGGVAGLVTIEDVIEEIVGEIDDEYDIDDDVFIKIDDNGEYVVQALTPIEEFNEYFRSSLNEDEFDTVSGLLLQAFGHLPKKGEQIELEAFHFEVTETNRRHIITLKVKPL